MQLLYSIVLAAALATGIAEAKPSPVNHNHIARGSSSKSESCGSNEFWYSERSCCLTQGGPSKTPSPPSGKSCPSSWYWHSEQSCCVPTHANPPAPTCSSGWGWESSSQYCTPKPAPKPTPKPTPKPSEPTCEKNEFWYSQRSCCLPNGGPSKTPTPPSGSDCPSSWYWHFGQGCCVPKNPSPPTPTCKSGWGWESGRQCCTPTPSKPTPTPKPSSNPHGGKGGYKVKRSFTNQWDVSFCPTGLTTCPISIHGLLTNDSECIDTLSDLTSCGGCASTGKGADCSKIPHASLSSCQGGVCVVEQCAAGFMPSDDDSSCVKA